MRRASSVTKAGLVVLCATLVASAPFIAGTPAAAAVDRGGESPLDKVARLIGEWRIDAHWSNGEALKGRQTYEWGLNRKFIVGKTFVTKNDGSGEYQRYESTTAVKDGKLVNYNLTFDGTSSVTEARVDGDILRVRRELEVQDGAAGTVIRQELQLTTGDKSRWQVWVVRDGKEEQVMDGTWVRSSKQDRPL